MKWGERWPTLGWYVLAAFVVGLAVGWATCGKPDDGRA